jgi:hypothetical protein
MNKIVNKILCILILVLFNLGFAQSQDTLSLKNENFLEKGRFAFVLELGTMFGNSSFFNGYNFLAKYHISDNIAFRINFRIDEGDGNYITDRTVDLSSYDGEVNANIQYYLSRKSFIKPFLSLGPMYSRYRYYRLETYSDDYAEDYIDYWNLGFIFTIGTEIFIRDNVSLIGEYIMKGTAGKDRRYKRNATYTSENDEFTTYSFTGNTARLGFSVYF